MAAANDVQGVQHDESWNHDMQLLAKDVTLLRRLLVGTSVDVSTPTDVLIDGGCHPGKKVYVPKAATENRHIPSPRRFDKDTRRISSAAGRWEVHPSGGFTEEVGSFFRREVSEGGLHGGHHGLAVP